MPDNVVVASFLRKPLGLLAATLAVGLAVIGAGMTVFGGTSGSGPNPPPPNLPAPVTQAQFKRAAMRICLSARALDKSIITAGKPRNLREAARYFRRFTPRFDQLTRDVDALTPPPSATAEAAALRRLRGKLHRFDRALDRLDHFAETRQWRMFVLLARSPGFKHLVRQFGSSRKLRDIHCGQNSLNIA
jgi:hypothetical protein